MKPIQTNKPVFFGNDGDVLKSGQIYIGQPNQYPVSFPKTVTFQDSSGAQFEAQQPLRTNDQGQVSYNGKAIIALVDGNYSMLIQDRNGATVQDGYTPFVSNPGEAEVNLGSVTQVGLLLPDIKLLDVTPGDTVRNVGKITATDGLGADWLVVSNTGNPADDVDLIGFANGLQGQRINSQTYEKDVSQTGTIYLDTPATIVNSSDATAYRTTWTNIDISSVVPLEASSAILRIRSDATYTAATANTISIEVAVRKAGQATTVTQGSVGRSLQQANTADTIGVRLATECSVPVTAGAASNFDFWLAVNDPSSSSNNTAPNLQIYVVGYTINYSDVTG